MMPAAVVVPRVVTYPRLRAMQVELGVACFLCFAYSSLLNSSSVALDGDNRAVKSAVAYWCVSARRCFSL